MNAVVPRLRTRSTRPSASTITAATMRIMGWESISGLFIHVLLIRHAVKVSRAGARLLRAALRVLEATLRVLAFDRAKYHENKTTDQRQKADYRDLAITVVSRWPDAVSQHPQPTDGEERHHVSQLDGFLLQQVVLIPGATIEGSLPLRSRSIRLRRARRPIVHRSRTSASSVSLKLSAQENE